jgi:hypothetical protein
MSTLTAHGQRRSKRIHLKTYIESVKLSDQDMKKNLQHQQYGKKAASAATV